MKEALASPGDPLGHLGATLRASWTGNVDDFEWLLEYHGSMLLPTREVALAAQFKLAGGAVVRVTPSLLGLLASTDIGSECPAMFVQPGFEMMYLVESGRAALVRQQPEPGNLVPPLRVERQQRRQALSAR